MKLDPELIHPSLFVATDRFTQGAYIAGGENATPGFRQAMLDHQRVWTREHGLGFGVGLTAFVASVVAVAGMKSVLGKPWTGIAVIGIIALGILAMAVWYQRNKRRLTTDGLAAILPVLQVTGIQRAYAESLIALAELSLPIETYHEVMGQLNRLLDEESRLLQIRTRSATTSITPDQVAKERAEIAQRLATSEDSVTRAALERSLELCESRLRASHDLSLVEQRVDAQLEMISQAIYGVRDSLLRLRSAPSESGVGLDLGSIRESVEHAHRHSVALEAAVTELQAIG